MERCNSKFLKRPFNSMLEAVRARRRILHLLVLKAHVEEDVTRPVVLTREAMPAVGVTHFLHAVIHSLNIR